AGVTGPRSMTARSVMPLLVSENGGQIDPDRDAVFTGRERHVAGARAGNLPYPQRAIRTDRYLYIINFEPERYPMGDGPGYGRSDGEMPSAEKLTQNTFAAFADLDASPTKAWIALHQDSEPQAFRIAFDRRPREELYDLNTDPHCLKNLVGDDAHEQTRSGLEARLLHELRRTEDPRLRPDVIFEDVPYTLPKQ
ncbi:MAG: sulfatase, partial [Planctomycetota bacterium]